MSRVYVKSKLRAVINSTLSYIKEFENAVSATAIKPAILPPAIDDLPLQILQERDRIFFQWLVSGMDSSDIEMLRGQMPDWVPRVLRYHRLTGQFTADWIPPRAYFESILDEAALPQDSERHYRRGNFQHRYKR